MKNFGLFWIPFVLCACAGTLPPSSVIPNSESPSPGDAVRITWMGTAGFHVTDGETAFYIDPFVSRYGLLKVGLGFSLPPRTDLVAEWCRKTGNADAVIVSHSHYDHVMDAPFFARETGAVLVGSESTAWVGRGTGLAEDRIRIVKGGDTIRLGQFEIRFLESRHGPSLFGRIPWPGRIDAPLVPPAAASDYRLGDTFTLLIRHPHGTLAHNGSAGYLPGMFDGIVADVVLLGIAGRADSRSLIDNVVVPLKAKTVIPIHYDHFFSPLDKPAKPLIGVNLKEFEKIAEAYKDHFRIRWIPIGESARLFP